MPSSAESDTHKLQSHGCPGHDSPDSRCTICLDRFDNISHPNSCLHSFCFCCIQQWAETKAECPLCKKRFHSIIHSVRAEDDFKEYVLSPTMNGSFSLYPAGEHVRNIQNGGRYRGISADFYRRNPACLQRLNLWLKRELTLLYGAHGSFVNIAQNIIISNVTRYNMDSHDFVEDLRPFLLHHTDHFLHELITNIEIYDYHANNDCPPQSNEEGSRSESSVNSISTNKVDTKGPDVTFSVLGVGQAPWDDEMPGPSYSTSTAMATEQTYSDQPSGKRKYKSCHLEKEAINEETHDGKGKEEHLKVARSSPGRRTGSYKNDLVVSSCNEPKKKWRRKARRLVRK